MRDGRFLLARGVVPILLAICAGLSACASAPRAEEEDDGDGAPLVIARSIHQANEEFPGVELSERRFVLSTQGRATVSAPDSATARRALAAAFVVADSVERLLDRLNPGSEVAAVNRAAGTQPVEISPWTQTAIAAALRWAERSGGAFDPTVGPLVNLWGFGPSTEPRVPNPASIEAALSHVGWSRVELDTLAGTVFLPDSGMELDLRAVMKGFALDRMREAMLDAGATSGIVDFSGDLVFFGPGPESTGGLWPIELKNPFDPDDGFAIFEMPPGSASTSSSLKRQVTIGSQRYGHLIDPRSGRPIDLGLVSVSVFSQDALTSDILATSLFVLGPMGGPEMVEQWPEVDAVFVTDTPPQSRSAVIVTTGLEEHRQWINPPYRPLDTED
ncbi:MAG: FAD:protein FMN transferase [Gemmatimonadota bacterium]